MIFIFGLAGLLVTLYAIYVEKYAKKANFKAVCDIGENASCSLVLTSKYANLAKLYLHLSGDSVFNLPNTYYGLFFYLAVMLYTIFPFTYIPYREILLVIASVMAVSMSIFLGWILYSKLKNFCAVCAVTYVINMGILSMAIYEFFQ